MPDPYVSFTSTMSTTLYGIKNCDSVRAARRWLDNHSIDYNFCDVRAQAPSTEQLRRWIAELGLALVNKRSTTWKQLDQQLRDNLDEASAVALLRQHPTLMKRPVLDTGKQRHLGFSAEDYRSLFAQHTL